MKVGVLVVYSSLAAAFVDKDGPSPFTTPHPPLCAGLVGGARGVAGLWAGLARGGRWGGIALAGAEAPPPGRRRVSLRHPGSALLRSAAWPHPAARRAIATGRHGMSRTGGSLVTLAVSQVSGFAGT